MSIKRAVNDYLIADAGINAAVGGRVYDGRVPKRLPGQPDNLPAIVLQIISEEAYTHLTNESAIRAPLIQIDVYDRDPKAQSDTIADLIRSRLSGYRGSLNSDTVCDSAVRQRTNQFDEPPDDGSDNWIRRVSSDYRIHYFAAAPAH